MGGRGNGGRQGDSLAGQTVQSLLSETKGGGEGSECPVLVLVWLQFELVCEDPRNRVLMMPPSLFISL